MKKNTRATSGIGKRLKEFRKSLGLQQKEIVEGLGISSATWSGYEQGTSSPSPKVMEKLRELRGMDLNWLITGEHSLPRSPETVGDFIEAIWPIIDNLDVSDDGKVALSFEGIDLGKFVGEYHKFTECLKMSGLADSDKAELFKTWAALRKEGRV